MNSGIHGLRESYRFRKGKNQEDRNQIMIELFSLSILTKNFPHFLSEEEVDANTITVVHITCN